jgi:hypothetical protein
MADTSTRLAADRPYPARTVPLPRSLDEVTVPWLNGLLGLRHPGIDLPGFDVVEVKNSHTTKLRLRLDLDDVARAAGIPEHVCLKSNWSGMRTGRICEREGRFYALVDGTAELPVPTGYFSDWDADGNGIVVMEDLALTPGAFGTSDDHLGVDGVAVGLETLARLHGAMWADPRLDSPWLPGNMDTDNDTEQVAQYWNYIWFNLADPAYEAVVPRWVYDTPELMHHVLDELSAFERALPGPKTLVHGDAHQGNSFLRADGRRVWVDWQLVRRGSPVRDISYFIVSSLTVAERRAADRDLVEHYRGHLVATGAEGVPGRDEVWEQFRRWPGYGTQAWLGNINLWGQRNGAEMVRRHFAASDDYDTVAILTHGKRTRRPYLGGEGAYRLGPDLQRLVDARQGSRTAPAPSDGA